MNDSEFSLIDQFFKSPAMLRDDVVYGIGDDAACLQIAPGNHLLVSTDTLVAGVHFLSDWDAYDIAWRSVMVNVSDMVAMAATPCWVTLALTLPEYHETWLTKFSQGLHAALKKYNISLVGGDTTRGPLTITITIHGTAPIGQSVRRVGAQAGDLIWVSGELGAAALGVSCLKHLDMDKSDKTEMMDALLHPRPRIELIPLLRRYATSAIDISDGLSADLNHICQASGIGACLSLSSIPIHPLVKKYRQEDAIDFTLGGGDDYELCFTTSPKHRDAVISESQAFGLVCYPIGDMVKDPGLKTLDAHENIRPLIPRGYRHF
jgi:thiamine-monophosphate kinase